MIGSIYFIFLSHFILHLFYYLGLRVRVSVMLHDTVTDNIITWHWEYHKMNYSLICDIWTLVSRTKEVDLVFFYFLFLFLFSFWFIFLLSIFRTRVTVRVTKITLSHSRSHQMTWSQVTWHMEGWCHTMCKTYVDLKTYTWSFRVGYK